MESKRAAERLAFALYGPRRRREALEAKVTASEDAALVLVYAKIILDRAGMEAKVTAPKDAATVLKLASIILDRSAMEAKAATPCQAGRGGARQYASKCPLCGTMGGYAGFTRFECINIGCENRNPK